MILSNILALPPTVILTILAVTSSAMEQQQLNRSARRSSGQHDDGEFVKRALDIKRRMQVEKPIGVKKMSTDEGEMFMLDNWIFASDLGRRAEQESYGNDTSEAQSPLRPLEVDDFFSRLKIRAALSKRQFACPAGTTSCAGIGAPDVCCGSGSNCVNVNNSPGVGSVGCCPQGQSCAGPISCDTNAGYSSCPNSPNGGCCLPGYACAGIGCAAVRTSTAFPPPPSTTPTPSPSPSSTAVIVVPTSPSTTPTPTPTPSSSPSSTSRTQSSTQAPSAPIRPTSGTMMSSSTVDVCPQGFYVCSAYYPSGACCRVGRDCMSTGSCDVPPSSTIINTNGVVVVAPTGAGVATGGSPQRGSCPSAWYSCPAQQGGNCCPEGFGCGEVCTATASDKSGVTQKVAPSQATFVSSASVWTMLMSFFATGVAMIVL